MLKIIVLWSVFTLLFLHQSQSTTIYDYTNILSSLSSDIGYCYKLFQGIDQGECNQICLATNCTETMSVLQNCSTVLSPGNLCPSIILIAESEQICLSELAPLFETTWCKIVTPTVESLLPSLQLNSTFISSCSSMKINSTAPSCLNACSQSTCSAYLSMVSECAVASGASTTCKAGLAALSYQVSSQYLDCEEYSANLCSTNPTNFTELVSPYLTFLLGSVPISNCGCLSQTITNDNYCPDQPTVLALSTNLQKVASTTPGCTTCSSALSAYLSFVGNSQCKSVSSSSTVCGSQNFSVIANSVNWDPYNENGICGYHVGLFQEQNPAPFFYPVPTLSSSPSPSESMSASQTPTRSITSSETPSESPSKSQTPTRSITSSETPTPSRTPSRTPSQTETPSESPSESRTPSRTPSQTETPSSSHTHVPSPTPSSTISESVTASITASRSITPSESPSESPSKSLSPTSTASLHLSTSGSSSFGSHWTMMGLISALLLLFW